MAPAHVIPVADGRCSWASCCGMGSMVGGFEGSARGSEITRRSFAARWAEVLVLVANRVGGIGIMRRDYMAICRVTGR